MTVDQQLRRGPVARLHQVWIFPVKSMRGTTVSTTAVTTSGLVSTFSMTHSTHAEDCDVREPRASLVLDLSAGSPAAADDTERGWIGRSVTLGAVTLDVVRRPEHCLGVYADVATAGQVAVGVEVTLA